MLRRFYSSSPLLITSPIFYVNAAPHVGHLYTAVLADTLHRWHQLRGSKTVYSIGTDEHGLKIQEAARKANRIPKEFCDEVAARFQDMFDNAGISYSRFIRTTDDDHRNAVQSLWVTLREKGYIYKGTHEGWYSVSDETFYPDVQVESRMDQSGSRVMVSKETGSVVEWSTEENYKFRLGSLRSKLIEWLEENPRVILPHAQYQNIVNSLRSQDSNESMDISISRPISRLQWGIPVPGDDSHVIYVWLDALTNYLTVSGYPWSSVSDQEASCWPARWHVVGKDIIKFHAIYWPAFLLAAGLPVPQQIISHCHWLQNNTKMSKSLGNVVGPQELIEFCGHIDPVRYFLMRDGGIEYDTDFSFDLVTVRYRELANVLGNLALRLSTKKVNLDMSVPKKEGNLGFGSVEEPLVEMLKSVRSEVTTKFESAQFSKALEHIISVITEANRYWTVVEPWKLAALARKGDENAAQHLQTALYLGFETIRICGILMQPVMPSKMETLLQWMGVQGDAVAWDCAVLGGHREYNGAATLTKLSPLFPKLEQIKS